MTRYANALSQELRVRAALAYNLSQIKVANEYLDDSGQVFQDPPLSIAEIQTFPAIIIVFDEEQVNAESNELLEIKVRIWLYCHIKDQDQPATVVAKLKQDIQSMLGHRNVSPASPGWSLPDSNGVPTCGMARYASSKPFSRLNNLPIACTKIGIDVIYQQLFQDPTQN